MELKQKLRNWKKKGLKVNLPKTKVMHSRHDVPKTKVHSVKFPCGVCYKGVGANSILCTSCNKWVHKRCTSVKGKLAKVENFVCKSCTTPAVPDDVRQSIVIDGDEFDMVKEFCYLGDVCGESGGCGDAATSRIRSAWKAFHELLPILTNRGISLPHRGNIFNTCIRRVLLHASDTWPLTQYDLTRIRKCDHAMIRRISGVKLDQRTLLTI